MESPNIIGETIIRTLYLKSGKIVRVFRTKRIPRSDIPEQILLDIKSPKHSYVGVARKRSVSRLECGEVLPFDIYGTWRLCTTQIE